LFRLPRRGPGHGTGVHRRRTLSSPTPGTGPRDRRSSTADSFVSHAADRATGPEFIDGGLFRLPRRGPGQGTGVHRRRTLSSPTPRTGPRDRSSSTADSFVSHAGDRARGPEFIDGGLSRLPRRGPGHGTGVHRRRTLSSPTPGTGPGDRSSSTADSLVSHAGDRARGPEFIDGGLSRLPRRGPGHGTGVHRRRTLSSPTPGTGPGDRSSSTADSLVS